VKTTSKVELTSSFDYTERTALNSHHMDVRIENRKITTELAQVATLNYGQMQRWHDFVPLHYSIEMAKELFIEKITSFFAEFRDAEMEEDETNDWPELIAFKNVGWPDLSQLAKEHTSILSDLIVYHQYDILHLIIERPASKHHYFYSLNAVDEVLFENEMIKLKGICFQSDYVEHTYNKELPRKYALLKKKTNNT